MAVSSPVRVERLKLQRAREQALIKVLTSEAFVDQLALLAGVGGSYFLGKSRVLNRDLAGVLCATSAVVAAARAGVTDKYALGVLFTAVAAAYAMAVPVKEGEEFISVEAPTNQGFSGFMLGSDEQLFFLPKNVSKGLLYGAFPAGGLADAIKGWKEGGT